MVFNFWLTGENNWVTMISWLELESDFPKANHGSQSVMAVFYAFLSLI
jgi:hypothetical protein